MRLPVTTSLSTKDGVNNKNARLTNCLKEKLQTRELAVVRPGLETVATTTGNGNGLVCFNENLISVNGANLGDASIHGWFSGAMPTTNAWWPVCWGGGVFCAIAFASDVCAISTDGEHWTQGLMPSIGNWVNVSWNGSLFFATTATTIAATSTDGLIWTSRTLPQNGWVAGGVVNFNGIFHLIRYYPINSHYKTSNGVTFTAVSTGFIGPTGIATDGSTLMVVGGDLKTAYSTDGVGWTAAYDALTPYYIATLGSTFFGWALGGVSVIRKFSGGTWVNVSNNIGDILTELGIDVAYEQSAMKAIEHAGKIYAQVTTWSETQGIYLHFIMSSSDLSVWDVEDIGVFAASKCYASNTSTLVIPTTSGDNNYRNDVISITQITDGRYDFTQSPL